MGKYFARADLIRFVADDHVHEREIKPEVLESLGVAKRGRRKSVDVSLSLADYEPLFVIECSQCEKHLADDPRFANNLDKLPLTPDEELKRVRDEKEGNVLTRLMAVAMAEAAANAVNKQKGGV